MPSVTLTNVRGQSATATSLPELNHLLRRGFTPDSGTVMAAAAQFDPSVATQGQALEQYTSDALKAALGSAFSPAVGWRSVLDSEFGGVAAAAVPDAAITSGSTTVTSPGGYFKQSMSGQRFHLPRAGAVLGGTSAYPWAPSPLVGTFTYVSATQGTVSAAAVSSTSGQKMVVGPDCTAAVNAALVAGPAFIPKNTDLLLAGEVVIGSNQTLRGADRDTSRLIAVTPNNSVIVAPLSVSPQISDLTIIGTGFGTQPPNTTPANGQAPNTAGAGCGILFAGVTRGKIDNVRVYHCGGDLTVGHNGVAGIWTTFGSAMVQVRGCYIAYCRNGINEDNYFNGTTDQPPFFSDYTSNITENCGFGFSIDAGANTRGCVITNHVARFCIYDGIDVHRSRYVTIDSPRCEFNGSNYSGSGIIVYGDNASVTCENVTIIGPMCFGNGQHGVKFSDYVRDAKVIGGISGRNFRHGIYINNNCQGITITDTTVRNNGLGSDNPGNYDGVRITASSQVSVRVRAFDDQTTPTQNWGVRADGAADYVTVDDATLFSGNKVGPVSLVGTNSRIGARTRPQVALVAQGLIGESFSRMMATGLFTPAAGDQRATLVGLLAGEVISSVYLHVTAAGTGVTLARVGIWSAAGSLLASSGDLSAQFTSGTGPKGGALSTPFTVPADGGYYIGAVFVGGTSPSVLRGTSGITGYSGQAVGSGAPPSVGVSGRTDIGTMTIAASGNAPWIGWS